MKRISIAFAAIISLSLGAVLVGCQNSPNQNPDENSTRNQTTQTAQETATFKLDSKKELQLTNSEIKSAEDKITKGKVSDDSILTFNQKDINLVVRTGPADDMLSYHIQGIRNPTLVIPSGATLKVLFVNMDDDMTHDVIFGAAKSPFAQHPDTAKTVGSDRIAQVEKEQFSAQQFTISADHDGVASYFCSVRGHAKKGMWGTIAVGQIAASQKLPSGHDAGERHNHDSHDSAEMMDDMHTKGSAMMEGDTPKKATGMMR